VVCPAVAAGAVGLVAFVVTGLAAGDDANPAPTTTDPASAAAVQEREQHEAELATPEAQQEREESRDAYADQSGTEALATAQAEFGGFVNRPLWPGPPLRPGEEVDHYEGLFSAVIERPNAPDLLMESTAPLRSRADSGHLEPVDTTLVPEHGDLEPDNAPSPISIDRDTGGTVTFARSGLGFRIAGETDATAQVVGDKAFFANVGSGSDTDLIAATAPGGADLALQLRSADSPTDPALALDLPDEAALYVQNNLDASSSTPAGGAAVLQDGRALATILPPIASDADGEPVPASYEAQQGKLVIHVDHRGRDVHYPVLVDPYVIEDYDGGTTSANSDFRDASTNNPSPSKWKFYDVLDPNDPSVAPDGPFGGSQGGTAPNNRYGLNLEMYQGQSYADGKYAQWYWKAPSTSQIVRVDYTGIAHDLNSSEVRLGIAKVWNPTTTAEWQGSPGNNPNIITGNQTNTWRTICTDLTSPCANKDATDSNFAIFRFRSTGGGMPRASSNYAALGQAKISLWEGKKPTITGTVPVAGQRPPSDWFDDTQLDPDQRSDTFRVTATDPGLGFGSVSLTRPKLGGGTVTTPPAGSLDGTANCSGDRFDPASPCDDATVVLPPYGKPALSYDFASLPEGDNTISVSANDVVGNPSYAGAGTSWHAKVDRTPPTLAPLSGALWDNRKSVTPSLPDGTYQLHIAATDGSTASAGARRSGVGSITIYVDGEEQDEVEQDCATDSCAMSYDWTFDTADYASGDHVIEVNAADQLGHIASQSFTVSRPCCMTTTALWGTFNGYTGALYADVDADGPADAIARDSLGDVDVVQGTGTAFAGQEEWGSFSTAYGLNAADVNGDGKADLAGATSNAGVSNDVSVELSTGAQFGGRTSWGTLPVNYKAYFADVSGDGSDDLVAINPGSGQIMTGYSNGTGFDDLLSGGSADTGYTYAFADVDGDAVDDLVETDPSTGAVKIGLVEGGVAAAPVVWGTYGSGAKLLVDDVNGDDQADVVAVDNGSASVDVRASDGEGFGTATRYGTWDNSFAPRLADVNGDGVNDMVGQNAVGGIAGSLTDGPIPDAEPGEPLTAASAIQYGGDVLPGPKPNLAFKDQGWLYTRVQQVPTGSTQSLSDLNPNQVHIYQRIREAGGTVVRFNAIWGSIETRSGNPPYDFRQLDAAVLLARQQGLEVELTITGADAQNNCDGKNSDTIGCGVQSDTTGCADGALYAGPSLAENHVGGLSTDTADPRNNYACFTDAYGAFVKAVVDHYTRDDTPAHLPLTPTQANPTRRVRTFAIWNEPNGRDWLRDRRDAKLIPTRLYRLLYRSAYSAYSSSITATPALPAGAAQILIGELSAARWKDGHTHQVVRENDGSTSEFTDTVPLDNGSHRLPCAKNCTMSPLAFLATVASNGPQGALIANGIAYHPYQHDLPPWQHFKACGTKYTGIGRAGLIGRQRDVLYSPGSRSNEKCLYKPATQALKTPDNKAPPIFHTEFGYLNRPRSIDNPTKKHDNPQRLFHKETTRAWWFTGYASKELNQQKHAGAIERAGGAMWLLFYHMVELPPPTDVTVQQPWDSGLMSPPFWDNPATTDHALTYDDPDRPSFDIKGDRLYDKRPEKNGELKLTPAQRRAYCKIRKWASDPDHPYPGAKRCPKSQFKP
jgi:hypothetical protein